jgi:hypothetical protein
MENEMANSIGLENVKKDSENMRKRVMLAYSMRMQGHSNEEIEKAVDAISKPDMVDLLIQEME